MTLVAKVDNVALPDGALLIGGAPNSELPGGVQGLPASAYYGEALQGGLSIDDPGGVYEFDGLHTFTVDETDCIGRERTWNGYIYGRRVHRGPYKSGVSRVWDVDIIEMNWLFALMVFRAGSAQRPAETDLVRAEYIIESGPMSFTPTVDNGRANFTDNPVNFDDQNMVATYPIEALNAFTSIAGKNFYNYWDQDEAENSFHYDLIGVGPAATLSISNDISDTSSTRFYPFLDGELDQGPEWTVTGMLLGYKGAYAYGIRQPTIDALSPTVFSPVEMQRDEVYRTDRIGKLETALNTIATMLNDRAVDRNTIKCSIRVPSSQVNLVEQGDVMTVKFTHLPGYETATDLPVIRRNVVPTAGRTDMYDIHLELSDVGIPTGPGGGGGEVFPPPPPVVCDVANIVIVQSEHDSVTSPAANTFINVAGAAWPAPPTPGNLLIAAWMSFSQQSKTPGTMTGWNQVNTPESFVGGGGSGGQVVIFWKLAQASEVTLPLAEGGTYSGSNLSKSNMYLIEVAGAGGFDTFAQGHSETETTTPGFTITPTAGTIGIAFTFQEVNQMAIGVPNGGETVLYVEGNISDAGNPGRWIAYQTFDVSAGAIDVNRHFTGGHDANWAQVDVVFICTGSAEDTVCIDSGQPNPADEDVTPAADGTTTEFFTRCPYADGTLTVKVDGMNQTPAVVAYDTDAGLSFTLGFAPEVGEHVTVNYLGR